MSHRRSDSVRAQVNGCCAVDLSISEQLRWDIGRRASSHALLQHPAPVPCIIAVDRRVWLARAPTCLPFVQRDDALPSGMRRIDGAIRRDMRDWLDSRGNLHLWTPRIG